MRFNGNILLNYMSNAPLALAFERYLECRIFQYRDFAAPILDIGCGEGLFAHILFQDKIDSGVDPNPHELERARQLGAYLELIECPGDAIPKPDGSFRTVISNSVLEHIPDLAPVFKEIHRLLAVDGRFYMTVPAPQFEQNTLLNRLFLKLGLTDLAQRYRRLCSEVIWRQSNYHTLEGWKDLVTSHGFEVEDAFTYDPLSICLLNDFLYPFSIFEFVSKKLFNRWALFPALRRIFMFPMYLLVRISLERDGSTEQDGLVFLSLKKRK